MTKTVLIAISVAMLALGATTYAAGHRTRQSLDVRLLSKHGKFFVGGSLTFFGLALLVITALTRLLRWKVATCRPIGITASAIGPVIWQVLLQPEVPCLWWPIWPFGLNANART